MKEGREGGRESEIEIRKKSKREREKMKLRSQHLLTANGTHRWNGRMRRRKKIRYDGMTFNLK